MHRPRRHTSLALAALSLLAAVVGTGCAEGDGVTEGPPLADVLGPFPCRPSSTSMSLWAEDPDGTIMNAIAIGPDQVPIPASFASIGDGL
ncbi:MAG TPA: hypothetical protein PKH96_22970, partial [Gemmatimonadaceae bacterium]|nr:hypothetical protein [Gemmatimonadaceae bacterium]